MLEPRRSDGRNPRRVGPWVGEWRHGIERYSKYTLRQQLFHLERAFTHLGRGPLSLPLTLCLNKAPTMCSAQYQVLYQKKHVSVGMAGSYQNLRNRGDINNSPSLILP